MQSVYFTVQAEWVTIQEYAWLGRKGDSLGIVQEINHADKSFMYNLESLLEYERH